jgi:medium-chain acyl-[acyl-carrier-protein] hydrolase
LPPFLSILTALLSRQTRGGESSHVTTSLPLTGESPFIRRSVRIDARCRLVCLPHAGAGASGYAGWAELLPPEVELIAIQPPGREDRLREAPITRADALARMVAQALRPYLDTPLVLFGHSGGALLAFEVARELGKRRGATVAHLVVSGQPAPDVAPAEILHTLPDEAFHRRLAELGGTAAHLLADPDLLRLVTPTLRADFLLWESYEFRAGVPLPVPITAFGGVDDDRFGPDLLRTWAGHTSGGFQLRSFPGGHFYLLDRPADVVSAIIEETALDLEFSGKGTR